jgi:predicted nucleotidyltransferase
MTRSAQIIEALRQNQSRLEELGVVHAGVFGSTARGDARPDSDVDVLVFLAPDSHRTVFDLVRIEHAVEEVIPGPLDVAVADQLKPAISARVRAETVLAF